MLGIRNENYGFFPKNGVNLCPAVLPGSRNLKSIPINHFLLFNLFSKNCFVQLSDPFDVFDKFRYFSFSIFRIFIILTKSSKMLKGILGKRIIPKFYIFGKKREFFLVFRPKFYFLWILEIVLIFQTNFWEITLEFDHFKTTSENEHIDILIKVGILTKDWFWTKSKCW